MSFNRQKFAQRFHEGKANLKSNCYRDEDGVIYHNTRIVRFLGGREVSLHTGGWHTITTKEHINAVLGVLGIEAFIFQKDFRWFLKTPQGVTEFAEGMRVGSQPKHNTQDKVS